MGEENKGGGGGALKGFAELISLGIYFVASIFIGFGVGFYLDRYFGTKPWLTILFLIFGIAAGFKHLFMTVKKYGGWNDQNRGGGGGPGDGGEEGGRGDGEGGGEDEGDGVEGGRGKSGGNDGRGD